MANMMGLTIIWDLPIAIRQLNVFLLFFKYFKEEDFFKEEFTNFNSIQLD